MARSELEALLRHKIEKWIFGGRHGFVHGPHDGFEILRPAYPAKVWEFSQDRFRFRAHAACDNDLAVFRGGRANRGKRFGLGTVEKAASVNDNRRRVLMRVGEFVTLRAQTANDPFAIDKRLGAAKRHEGYFRCVSRLGKPCRRRRSAARSFEVHVIDWHAGRPLARNTVREQQSRSVTGPASLGPCFRAAAIQRHLAIVKALAIACLITQTFFAGLDLARHQTLGIRPDGRAHLCLLSVASRKADRQHGAHR